jgi:hypothetical protein
LVPCQQAPIEITVASPGLLDAWIDFSGDGDWSDPADQIFAGEPLSAGANQLTVVVSGGALAR